MCLIADFKLYFNDFIGLFILYIENCLAVVL